MGLTKKAEKSRIYNAKMNIVIGLISQLVTLVCGFIIPRLIIKNYGSIQYGATTSIAQFLGYISLLEGGVSGVARAALYKPLADNDSERINGIITEIQAFFRKIGYIFIIYVIILAVFFRSISHATDLEWSFTFFLVLSISISTFAQYFIGISYSVFLQAAQKAYITYYASIVTILLNTVATILLVRLGADLVIVKLVSSIIFVIKPIWFLSYVRKNYKIDKTISIKTNALNQKWIALGQHIAYYLHSNTDVAILTIFTNLAYVAVYAVYHMIIFSIQSITQSFSNGMEAVFGDMLAKDEHEKLQRTFRLYETMISLITIIMFSTTCIMIVPFIKLYTRDLTDANYIEPVFAYVLTFASVVFCLRLPYHSIIIAAGHFQQTKLGAYGEAIINIVSSIIFVKLYGLVGVAIGTVLATTFRFLYYVMYISSNIIKQDIRLFGKRVFINTITFAICLIIGNVLCGAIFKENYLRWILSAVLVFLTSFIITFSIYYFAYRNECRNAISLIARRMAKSNG